MCAAGCETTKTLRRAVKEASDALRAGDAETAQRILDRVMHLVRVEL